eukprot:2808638-Pyramimonas_sp.AAC.1
MWFSPQRRAHSFETGSRVSRVGGGPFSKYDCRLSASHIRFKQLKEFHGMRVGRLQHVDLALAPRTFVSTCCQRVTD